MFCWIKLRGLSDSKSLIEQKAVAAKVLLLPGEVFSVASPPTSPYVRASFSTASDAEIDAALARLAALLKSEVPKSSL